MKKRLFYWCALAVSVGLLAACSDDAEKTLPVDDVNGTYTAADTNHQLVLTYSGAEMSGKTVMFNSADGKTATLRLAGAGISLMEEAGMGTLLANPGVVPGEPSTTLDVALVATGETGYAFEGMDEKNGRKLTYKGTVEKGRLVLDVNAVFSNELLGTWNLQPVMGAEPLKLVWDSSEKFQITIIPVLGPTPIPPSSLLGTMCTMPLVPVGEKKVTVPKAVAALLSNVTFGADGNITASYSDVADMAAPVWKTSPLNLVQYVVKEGRTLLYLNVDAVMSAITGGTSQKSIDISSILQFVLPELPTLLPMLSEGIPLGYAIGEDGVLSIYIDQEGLGQPLLNILTKMTENKEFVQSIKDMVAADPSLASVKMYVDAVLDQLPKVAAGTTNLAIGLNFVAPEAAE